jgi:hypothetical protein
MMTALADAVAENAGAPFDAKAFFEALGLMAMDTASMTVGADGKHVALDGELRLRERERGMFALLHPSAPTKLPRLVPPAVDTFSVSSVDLGALTTMIGRVWEVMGDAVPMTWEQAQTQFAETMKVRLREDLLDHLGTELLTVQDLGEAGAADPDDPMAGFEGMCAGVALKNGKAFGESVEKLLRARGLHAARKTEDYQGTQVHRLRVGGIVELEYAITDDLLLLGLGSSESSRKSLRGVLDARANPPAAPEYPAPVKERLALLPASWSGLSVMSVSDTFRMMSQMIETGMQQGIGEVPEELGGMLGMLQQLGGELERFGLQTMVGTSHVTANAFTTRYRW